MSNLICVNFSDAPNSDFGEIPDIWQISKPNTDSVAVLNKPEGIRYKQREFA